MQVQVLIIGQGLCGSWLSYFLQEAGVSFLLVDDAQPQTPSKIASGIINPITGRRLVKTWLIDKVLPFAVDAYRQMEALLQAPLIRPCPIVDFFSAPDVELTFKKRVAEKAEYLQLLENTAEWQTYFQFPFGAGLTNDSWLVFTADFIRLWNDYLQRQNLLRQEAFDETLLHLTENRVQYKDIIAKQVIYCSGAKTAASQYFDRLPFAFNKGEALIASIPNLPSSFIYKKGMNLVPWSNGLWWAGSTYEWTFENDQPTAAFRQSTESWLKNFCKLPFKIVDHLAAVRPATVERRPFVGFHPVHPQVGILNGMGTKGVSLAPFFAKQLAEAIVSGQGIMAEADVKRFARIMSR